MLITRLYTIKQLHYRSRFFLLHNTQERMCNHVPTPTMLTSMSLCFSSVAFPGFATGGYWRFVTNVRMRNSFNHTHVHMTLAPPRVHTLRAWAQPHPHARGSYTIPHSNNGKRALSMWAWGCKIIGSFFPRLGVRLICSKFFLLFYSTVLINFPYYSFDYARLFFL